MSRMPYVPLTVLTNYSFLEGASFPEELVLQAAALDLPAIGIVDRDGVYGIVRAHVAARQTGVRLLVGSTLTRSDGPPVSLLVKSKAGYAALCQLISLGKHAGAPGSSAITTATLIQNAHEDLILIHPALYNEPHLELLFSAFRGRLYAALSRTLAPDDELRIQATRRAALPMGIPLVVAPWIYFHVPQRKRLADVLTAIRLVKPMDEVAGELLPNANFTLLPPSVMSRLYHEFPKEMKRSVDISRQCRFSLDELHYHYPQEVVPEGMTSMQALETLTWEMAGKRYHNEVPPTVAAQLRKELQLIEELEYPNYFLTMHDIVSFARRQKILCQGRGSAANSAVCFVLGITSVDPAHSNLLFERFISRERNEPPDIDVDFEHERREEVIQYIYQRYGRHRAAMVAEFIRYRTRSAVRDVGKALGFSLPQLDRLATLASSYRRDHEDWWERAVRDAGLDPAHPQMVSFQQLVKEIKGFPRHLSIHVGGFVISDIPIHHLVPIQPARMEGRTVIQWDKEDVEDAGLLKIDVLALGMLSALRRSLDLLKTHKKLELGLADIPADDTDTYDMICKADTVGVFQIESRAQMSMLPRLLPRNFYDLVVEVAIVRPGPIQGRMVHPYLRRRQGLEEVSYPLPELSQVLGRTYGVPLFQEQVMKLAMVAAGFTAGEADNLRRAMGMWRSNGRLDGLLELLMKRMEDRGIRPEYARQIADQIKGFGEYGFPESHAASFALLAYASAWVKRHHPDAFVAALLNSQPMGFYSPSSLLEDARHHGIRILPPSVQHSHWESTLEGPRYVTQQGAACLHLRLGFSMMRGVGEGAVTPILEERRKAGNFRSLADFTSRCRLPAHVMLKLALAGAFGVLGLERRQALWAVLGQAGEEMPLMRGQALGDPPEFKAMQSQEILLADLDATKGFLDLHPFELVAATVNRRRDYRSSRDLATCKSGERVLCAGLVIIRQRPPTANGTLFLTLEDSFGFINVIVGASVFRACRSVLLENLLLQVEGEVQKAGDMVNLQARQVKALLVPSQVERLSARDSVVPRVDFRRTSA